MSNCTPPLDPDIAIVLLAAGRARRFGGDKLSAPCAGMALALWAMRAAGEAGFATRLIVVQSPAPAFAVADGWTIVENPAPEDGLASSLRMGVRAAASARRIVVALADMPLIEARHLRALALADGSVFTAYPGWRAGVPAAFPVAIFPRLLSLEGDRGAMAIAAAIAHTTLDPDDPRSLIDVDTPAALAAASAQLARRRR